MIGFIGLGILIGLFIPMQSAMNSRLRRTVGSPLAASGVSFTVGGLFSLVLILLLDGPGNLGMPADADPAWWMWTAGLFALVSLTGNILLFMRLGAVPSVILPVAGQVIMSLLIDHFGWFRTLHSPVTATRLAGALLVMTGVIIAVGLLRAPRGRSTPTDPQTLLWSALGVSFGMTVTCMGAVTGALATEVHSSPKAAAVSSFVALGGILVLLAVTRTRPVYVRPDDRPNPWWMWFGGFVGATYLIGYATLIPAIGAGVAITALLVGKMSGSLLIDRFGLFDALRRRVLPSQLAGLALMLAGVALIQFS